MSTILRARRSHVAAFALFVVLFFGSRVSYATAYSPQSAARIHVSDRWNGQDISLIASNWMSTGYLPPSGAAAAVLEPASIGLAAWLPLSLLGLRRKRR